MTTTYTSIDLDKIVAEKWALASPGREQYLASREIAASITSGLSEMDAYALQRELGAAITRCMIASRPPKTAKIMAMEASTRALRLQEVPLARHGGAICRHCDGPVADSSGDCGECR